MNIKELLILISLFVLLITTLSIALWKYDEQRCYNMPLNDFYNDPLCVKHTTR